ncbi:MAG: ATPase, partial [Methanomicrobium sp.]|nr:ATPase [Methanomicrobium sp.]
IDIRPRSELARSAPSVSNDYDLSPSIDLDGTTGGVTENGVEIKIDKKNLMITAREYRGKIVDVFGGKEYLFTATVNDMGEIHMSKNNSIAMEMIRRYNDGEEIRLRPV